MCIEFEAIVRFTRLVRSEKQLLSKTVIEFWSRLKISTAFGRFINALIIFLELKNNKIVD